MRRSVVGCWLEEESNWVQELEIGGLGHLVEGLLGSAGGGYKRRGGLALSHCFCAALTGGNVQNNGST
jgi:hypothetical protein